MSVKLSNLRSNCEYNILLLGQTGVGKSTTINAFANYLKYGAFEQATSGDFVQLIPCKFHLPHPETGQPFVVESSIDDDKNERTDGDANSCTKAPVGYIFRYGGSLIRLIDTPGIGDTAGIDQDKANFDEILCFLRSVKPQTLHGIFILLKADTNRRTVFFNFCLSELLMYLHRSVCRNIVFCFTHSRNTFYQPGEGYSTLQAFLRNDLKDAPNLELKVGENCFFIDNEAYRFLVALKKGFPFSDSQLKAFRESWCQSVRQVEAMFDHVISLEPHSLEYTVLLNNARKLIIKMAEPLVQLQVNIADNIEHIKKEEKRLNLHNNNSNVTLDVYDLEMKPIAYPSTVCTSDRCTEVVDSKDGTVKVNYKTRCHEECSLEEVEVNLIGDTKLQQCSAMGGGSFAYCLHCGCDWKKHKHVTCEFVKVKRTIINNNSSNKTTNDNKCFQALEAMKKLSEEYELEQKAIQDVSAKFAYILSAHSTTPYNKYIEPYLDLLIEEEEKKMTAFLNYAHSGQKSLLRMKREHQEAVQILLDAMNQSKGTTSTSTTQQMTIREVPKLCDQLIGLKHTGAQFKQMMEMNIWCKQRQFRYLEKIGLDLTSEIN